jgi:hypothetical protein
LLSHLMTAFVVIISIFLLAYTLTYYGSIVLWAVLSARAARQRSGPVHKLWVNKTSARSDGLSLGVSVVVPVYNEGPVVVAAIRNLLLQTHPTFEVIVINDGSTDDTLARLQSAFDLRADSIPEPGPIPTQPLVGAFASATDSRVRVIDQINSGSKAGGRTRASTWLAIPGWQFAMATN